MGLSGAFLKKAAAHFLTSSLPRERTIKIADSRSEMKLIAHNKPIAHVEHNQKMLSDPAFVNIYNLTQTHKLYLNKNLKEN